jgi:hypothetical protein
MIIAQYKPTAIAKAPEAISDVINKYTNHNSYVIGYSYPKKGIIPETDIVHQHNKLIDTDKKNIIQFHSEPFRVALDATCPKLVIAQYHATLQEYSNCKIVRNPIDLYDEIFFPQYQQDIIRIGYSPSTLKPGSDWADKGYVETVPILNELKEIYKDKIEIDIIIGVPLKECLERKALCNIFIDEVKTTSYHRSGLEAMAMGSATICSIGSSVNKVLLEASGADRNPFINVNCDELKNKLIELIESGLNNVLELGYESRLWMEKYWDPKTIANEYIKIYEKWLD